MELVSILSSLDDYFSLSSGSLKTLKQLCVGFFEARTVNLQEVCNRFREGNFASNTRKVERFFANKHLCDKEMIRYIIDTLFAKDQAITLAIDRTEWGFGTCWHNLLCISVLYEKTAIPLIIFPLERRGNSNSQQRLQVLDTILSVVPTHRIEALLGDREFIGDEWFYGLKARKVPFVMRIRENITVSVGDKCDKISALVPVSGEGKYPNIHIGTQIFDLCVKRCKHDNLALISMNIDDPAAYYRQRWGIEIGFKCLKTNGFNLEDTHLKHPERIKTLVQSCALAMTLALKTYHINNIKKKRNDHGEKNMVLHKIHASHLLNVFS